METTTTVTVTKTWKEKKNIQENKEPQQSLGKLQEGYKLIIIGTTTRGIIIRTTSTTTK